MGCSSCGKTKSVERKRMIPVKPKNTPIKKRVIGNNTKRKKRPIPSRRKPR